MKTRSYKLSKYLVFSKAGVMGTFAYKFAIWSWQIVQIIEIALMCLLWMAVFASADSEVINGFTLKMMIAYVIVAKISSTVVYCSGSFYDFGSDIRSGNIAVSLTRPISYRMQLLFSTFGYFAANLLLCFLPMVLVGYAFLYLAFGVLPPDLLTLVLYFVSLFAALVLVDSLNFIFGSFAMFTGAIFGLGQIKDTIINFLAGGIIPLVFFPSWAQEILRWLPFPSLIATPNAIMLGQSDRVDSLVAIVIALGWAVVFYCIGQLIYRRLVKRVVSQGG